MRFRQLAILPAAAALVFWASACSDDSSSSSEPEIESSSSEELPELSSSSDSTGEQLSSSSAAASSASVEAPKDGLLLDDMEDGNGETAIGTFWYTYDDAGNGGASTITTAVDAEGAIAASPTDNGSKYAFKAEFSLVKADYEFDPFVGWGFKIPSSVDASKYAGIRYSYKGAAHYLHMETTDVTDYDVHLSSQKKSTTWTTVTVAFSDLMQGGWGIPVEFDPKHLDAVSFQVKGNGKTDSLIVDDIYFVKEGDLPPKVADMTIRDPIVYNLTIGDVAVTTPLQEKVMKYLDKGVNFTNWLEEAKGKFDGTFKHDESDVKLLSESGFKALRLPIDLDLYVTNRSEFLNDITGTVGLVMSDSIFIVLDSFVEWTKRYNMSLAIDYHEYDNSYNKESSVDAQYIKMMSEVWKAVAAHYADNEREDLFFELLNEPDMTNGKVTAANWTIAAQSMIDSIRSVDVKHTIIFGDAQWYSIDLLVKREPFADDNIVYAIHSYDPFLFTHQGASWTDYSSIRGVKFPYNPEEWSEYTADFGVTASTPSSAKSALKNYYKTGSKGYILSRALKAKEWAVKNQVPLVWNEFGAYSLKSDPQRVLNYLTAVREICDTLQIAWQHWGYTGGFAVVENGALIEGIDKALNLKK